MKYDVCIVGGAGHVGAPLAIVLANRGLKTLIYDTNETTLRTILGGNLPFVEEGGDEQLKKALASGFLAGSAKIADIADAESLILTIGTPVDEFHNPMWHTVTNCMEAFLPYLENTRQLILRSTVAPGTTDRLQDFLSQRKIKMGVAFCPERVVQGRAIDEIQRMPQIISGTSPEAEENAARIFGRINPNLVRLQPKEAEFAKLFCNAYRYIQFAVSNQFYMMATAADCDYHRIVSGIKADYPRMNDFPGPGFAAGPCLLKDTLQLAASSSHSFEMGYASMHVNEGLPAFILENALRQHSLAGKSVGILGMAFKAESDDPRSSLSYKLKKLLRLHAREVLTTDPYVNNDQELVPLDEVLEKCDLFFLATPHKIYRSLDLRGKPVIDIWNILPTG